MSDFLDNDDQINAFIRAMNARTTATRPSPVSRASSSAPARQPLILTPPSETEDEVLAEDESEDSMLGGGIELTSEEWIAGTSTAVNSTAVASDVASSATTSNIPSSPPQPSPSTRTGGQTIASSSTVVSGVRPSPPTPQMTAQRDFSAESYSGDAVQTILGAFASSSPHNLADSIHAPHHVRTNENGVRPILLSSIQKVMEQDRVKKSRTVYETDPSVGHSAPSKIDDNASAFITAMNARMNPSKAKSSGNSAETTNSDTTLTPVSTPSTLTLKKQESKPFGKEEARNLLLLSPKKRIFGENEDESKSTNKHQVNDVEAPGPTSGNTHMGGHLTAEALHTQARLQDEEAAIIKEEQEFEARKAKLEAKRAALDAAFARMEEEHRSKKRSAPVSTPVPTPKVDSIPKAAEFESVVPAAQTKATTIKDIFAPATPVEQAPTPAIAKDTATKSAHIQAGPSSAEPKRSPAKAIVPSSAEPTPSPAKVKPPHRSNSLSFAPATEVVANLRVPEAIANAPIRNTTQGDDQDNRENQVYFSSWGTAARGDRANRPTARRRKVTLVQLPPDITPKQVAMLLFNGAIDTFSIVRSTVDSSVAEAIFTTGDGCKAYYDATPNGLQLMFKEKAYTIMIEIDPHVAPVSSQLQEWLDKGVTRCVRAVGVDEQWKIPALWRVAEGTKRVLRKVEHVVDTKNPAGTRVVIFRFTNIADAVQFRGVLARDEDWEGANISFSPDPCALATKTHID